ncbi:DUF2937 family protein [Jiella mangrovi]|uniref:DUF2937 family protein n=1 Tax=Jiella mangrovi TaxID=2821407 RepID=A0ABS4BHU2_9HYPH|nr:DUF2937 family protein [Jiella mangrovi]MBP0616323.1 DUF2937 family protein [Jiella mangrovi]
MPQPGEAEKENRLSAFLARVVAALFGGLLFSQSAEFTQQYLQRLGGAADEMRAVVRRFEEGAAVSKLTPDQAIERLKRNDDEVAIRQGSDAEENRDRYRSLERRYQSLTATSPLLRPFEAAADPDWSVVSRAAGDYRPAIPATGDGVILALGGFVLGWACGGGAHGAVALAKRRRKRRSEAAQTSDDLLN